MVTIATRSISDVHHQIFVPYQRNQQDAFAGAGNGVTIDVSLIPCSRFALQVKGTGAAPDAWSVVLEVSLEGANFTTLITHANGTEVDGSIKFAALPAPVKHFRSRCVSLTLGAASDIMVTIIGEAGV